MSENYIQISEGSGKKLHSFDRTISGNAVHDEVMVLGEQYLPSYSVTALNIPIATANDHTLQLMAGSTNRVRVRKISIVQTGLPASATLAAFDVMRLTTAGTGGSALTPFAFDTSSSAATASVLTQTTSKGTESGRLTRFRLPLVSAHPIGEGVVWQQAPNQQPWIISAGTSNGIVIKNLVAVATATIDIVVEFDEASF